MSDDLGTARKGRRRRPRPLRRMPYVAQLEAADCGVACLAMVLAYWRHPVSAHELREALGSQGAGIDARTLLDTATRYGLRGRGLSVDLGRLATLPTGTILHWEFAHFVVFVRATRDGVEILDPASGRRLVPMEQVARAFTGIALELEPDVGFTARPDARRGLWPYVRRLFADAPTLRRILAMSLLLQILAATVPAMMGVVIDRVVPRADLDLLWIVTLGAGGTVAFCILAALARSLSMIELQTRLDMGMTTDFIGHLVSLPFAFFLRRPAGDLMMRVGGNAAVREFLTTNVVSGVLDASVVGLYLVVMVVLSPLLAALTLVLGLARVLLLLASRRRLADLMAAQLEAQAGTQSHLAQMLAGIETLKAAGAERRAVQRWADLYSRELVQVARRGRLSATVESLLHGIASASPIVILCTGSWLVLQHELTLGTMLALSSLATAFFGPLSALVSSGLQLSALDGYLDRMADVLATPPEQDADAVSPAPRLRGAISLRNVSFAYRSDGPLAVDDASLEIRAGQAVAIVGASGSGKTTLANLLIGAYRPGSGRILFDGHDGANLEVGSLRRQIGTVPQSPYLFASTIRDNIALGEPQMELAKIARAAAMACIDADIERLPLRYDSPLADRGESLSGGQRQRIALARAVVRRPAILLLDEATSALDARTEQAVTRNLERLQCTRIIIAHRLSTVARADMIVVMDQGRIVEVGRHGELLSRGSVYRRLVEAQRDPSGLEQECA